MLIEKHKLKKKKGLENLKGIIEEALEIDDWEDREKAEFHQNLSGDFNINMLIKPEVQEKLQELGVPCINELQQDGLAWYVLSEVIEKKTKNNKTYLLLTVLDNANGHHKIYVWGGRSCSFMKKNDVYVAELKSGDFGFSTFMPKIQKLE